MRNPTLFLYLSLILIQLAGTLGCAEGIHIGVHPLTDQRFPQHPQGFVIDEWEIPPTQSFVRLAKINGKGSPEADDEILARVLDEARKLGADGVIIEKADLLQTFDRPRRVSSEDRLVDSSITSTGGSNDLSIFPGQGNFGQNAPEGFKEVFFLSATAIKYVP